MDSDGIINPPLPPRLEVKVNLTFMANTHTLRCSSTTGVEIDNPGARGYTD